MPVPRLADMAGLFKSAAVLGVAAEATAGAVSSLRPRFGEETAETVGMATSSASPRAPHIPTPSTGPTRRRLLDLFCCAGGAGRGYQLAGFEVVGVDIAPQPRYAGDLFFQGDAIDLGARMLTEPARYGAFHAVHASPPCQAHSLLQRQNKREYADFIPQTRELLDSSGLPYIIENVEGAPLHDPVRLCGAMFPELRVYRHRLFESNVRLQVPPHPRHTSKTFTYDKRKKHYGLPITPDSFIQVTGGGNAPVADKARAMGITWMTGRELNEALPPAYTQLLGVQLLSAASTADAA